MSLRNPIEHRGITRICDLTTTSTPWTMTVYIPVRYWFRSRDPDDPVWTQSEANDWVEQFEEVTQDTWSHVWNLRGTRLSAGFLCEEVIPTIVSDALGICEPSVETVEVDPALAIMGLMRRIGQQEVYWSDDERNSRCREADLQVFPVNVFHRTRAGRDAVIAAEDGTDRGVIQLPQDGIRERPPFEDAPYDQRASDHEIGHSLTLEHPFCQENSLQCYGWMNGTARQGSESVMGIGNTITLAAYEPFREIMSLLDGRYTWTIVSPTPAAASGTRSLLGPAPSPFRRPVISPEMHRRPV